MEEKKMYRCTHCKHLFEEPEVRSYTECVGEFWGTPAYDTFTDEHCPDCGSDDFEEVHSTCWNCKYIDKCGNYENYDPCNDFEEDEDV